MTKCLSQRERERERKSTPAQCLGYKRKKEGGKKRTFSTLCFGAKENTNITHDDK